MTVVPINQALVMSRPAGQSVPACPCLTRVVQESGRPDMKSPIVLTLVGCDLTAAAEHIADGAADQAGDQGNADVERQSFGEEHQVQH